MINFRIIKTELQREDFTKLQTYGTPKYITVSFIHYILREPDLIWPSKNTSYETDRVLLRNFDHIDEFVDEFRQLNPENILNRHMATRLFNGENTSGLSMGRIFAFRLYLESYDKRRYN